MVVSAIIKDDQIVLVTRDTEHMGGPEIKGPDIPERGTRKR
jgi:hypothetical protein